MSDRHDGHSGENVKLPLRASVGAQLRRHNSSCGQSWLEWASSLQSWKSRPEQMTIITWRKEKGRPRMGASTSWCVLAISVGRN